MSYDDDLALVTKHQTQIQSVVYCECVGHPCQCKLTVARWLEELAALRAARKKTERTVATLYELAVECKDVLWVARGALRSGTGMHNALHKANALWDRLDRWLANNPQPDAQ